MKHILITTIAAVVLVGCGPSGLLHEALREGNIEAVKQAIADGVDVNAKDDYGVTPLYRAAYIGHKEIANLLISKGADVNAKNDDGWTPLHQASAGGHKEVAELLIGKGADVNAKADDGRTPLHSAAYWGRKEVAALLIGKGADVNTKIEVGEYKGQTPLDIATLPNNPNKTETADLLRKHGGKSGAEDSIHIASQMGNVEALKQHLAAGADVNAKNRYGSTPLHYAAMEGHKEIVELLISKGADVDAKSNRGTTPLLAASPRPSPGRAPFGGHKEIVEILIANGADVNAKDRDGMTPLFMAAIVGQSAALMGQSAESALCKEIADLLRKHGGKTGEELEGGEPVAEATQPEPPTAKAPATSIHDAAYDGSIEAVKQHLANGADVNAKDDDGWTPLHWAATLVGGNGQKETTELLIAEGANVNAKDDDGWTPLHSAALVGHKEIAELLIAAGADVNTKDDGGDTPLDSADSEIADLLRKHGGKTGEELKAEGK